MKKTSKLARFFKFAWLSNYPPDKKWDEVLNKILDMGITDVGEYYATFGGKFHIWIRNHPYASGHLHGIGEDWYNNPAIKQNTLPYMSTRIRLEDIVNKHLEETKQDLYSDLFKD